MTSTRRPLLRRGDEHLPAGRESHAIAFRGQRDRGQVVHGLLHPGLARLVEVRREADVEGRVRAAREVEETQVGAQLVDDPPVRERRRVRVPALVARVLAQVAAVLVHRPDVHAAVPVAQEVDAAAPPHRPLARSRVVAGEGHGLGRAKGLLPEALRGAPAVALRVAALERQPREEERAPVGRKGAVRGLGERQDRASAAREVEAHELGVGQRAEPLRRVDEGAGRREPDDARPAAVERAPDRRAAGERHGVDLGRALVPGRERERRPVGGEGGVRLARRVAGEARRDAALPADLPQVALGAEHDRVCVNRREAVVADRAGRGRLRGQGQEQGEAEHQGHGRPPLGAGILPRPSLRSAMSSRSPAKSGFRTPR